MAARRLRVIATSIGMEDETQVKPHRPAEPPTYRPFPDIAARNGLQALLEVPLMIHSLGLPVGGRILELGCGRGVALPVLARLCRPALLVGVDIDRDFVAIADRSAADARIAANLIQGDVQSLAFMQSSFDMIIDFGTCYHVPEPTNALREVARVLRPGGLFVHETPVSQHLAHPVRSFGRRLPWARVPELRPYRHAMLWAVRRREVESR